MTRRPTPTAYDTPAFYRQYLTFHYGTRADIAPPKGLERGLEYPVRVVRETVDRKRLPRHARALDIGCSVGRSTFELARMCESVVGVDLAADFIDAAKTLQKKGSITYSRVDDSELMTKKTARVPAGIDRSRVAFEVGDAMNLRPGLGTFDVIIGANLLDRLPDPGKFLAGLKDKVNPGGQLALGSPHSWLERYTPRSRWLSGRMAGGKRLSVFDSQKKILGEDFELVRHFDIEFLMRDHARHFQWGVAEWVIWRRRGGARRSA